jgi:hypothetical protein
MRLGQTLGRSITEGEILGSSCWQGFDNVGVVVLPVVEILQQLADFVDQLVPLLMLRYKR